MQWRRRRKVHYVIGSAHHSLLISHYRLPFPGEPPVNATRGTSANEPADSQSASTDRGTNEWDHEAEDCSGQRSETLSVASPECEPETQDSAEGDGCFVNGLWIPASELPNFSPCQPPQMVPGYPFLFPAALCHTPYPRFRTFHAPDVPLFPNYFIPSDPHYYFYLIRPHHQEKAPEPYEGPSPYLQAMNMPWGGRPPSNNEEEEEPSGSRTEDQGPAQYVYPGFTFGPSVYGTQTFLPPPQIPSLPVFVNTTNSQRRRRRKRRGRTDEESECCDDNYSQITTRSYDALRQTRSAKSKSKETLNAAGKNQTELAKNDSATSLLDGNPKDIIPSNTINHLAEALAKQVMLEAQEEMTEKTSSSELQTNNAQNEFSSSVISKNGQSSHHALSYETRNSSITNSDENISQTSKLNENKTENNLVVHDESTNIIELVKSSAEVIPKSNAGSNFKNKELVSSQLYLDSVNNQNSGITDCTISQDDHNNPQTANKQSLSHANNLHNTHPALEIKSEGPSKTELISANNFPVVSDSNNDSLQCSPGLELNSIVSSNKNTKTADSSTSNQIIPQIHKESTEIHKTSSVPNTDSVNEHSSKILSKSLEKPSLTNLSSTCSESSFISQVYQTPQKSSSSEKEENPKAISYGPVHVFEVTRVPTPVDPEMVALQKANTEAAEQQIETEKSNSGTQKTTEEEQSSTFSYLSEALIRETELELNRYQQLTARTSLQTTQSLYKLAYDECISDQSDGDDSDSSIPSFKQSPPHIQQFNRRQSEIIVHEVDSASDAGSEDVELLPHRYESQNIENKHLYVNKLSLAAELLRTKENLPYDKEFKMVVDEDRQPADKKTKEMRSVLEDYYSFCTQPIHNKQPKSIGADNPAFVEDSINTEDCHRISRISAADSGVQSDDSEEEIGQEAKEEIEKYNSSNSEEMNGFQSSSGYRRFGAAHKLPFVATNKGALSPCWCCIIM